MASAINNHFAKEHRWHYVLGLNTNYFADPSGAFISLVWSTPFVVSGFVSLVGKKCKLLPHGYQILLLFRTAKLVVLVKKHELRSASNSAVAMKGDDTRA